MAGTRVPFPFVTGLPEQARREIERNFLHVTQQLGAGAATGFDAVIDGGLSTSSAASHLYKNITDMLAGEAANIVSTRVFKVAVVGRPASPSVETANMTFNGPISFHGAGIGGTGAPFGINKRPLFDFAGFTVTNSSWACFFNCEIASSASVTNYFSGSVYFDNCVVSGLDLGGTTQKLTSAITSGSYFMARNTAIQQCTQVLASGSNGYIWMADCLWLWPVAGGNITMSDQNFYFDGGTLDPAGASPTLVLSGTSVGFVRCGASSHFTGASSGTVLAVSITTSGHSYVDIEQFGNPPNLSISATAGDCIIRGSWRNVLVSGNNNNAVRKIDISHNNGALDVTGPCELRATVGGGNSPQAILRGSGVRADLLLDQGGVNPWLKCVGLIDSIVTAAYMPPGGAGAQAYTIDAGSARCYLRLGGALNANFSVASTNAGTTCRVGTETAGS